MGRFLILCVTVLLLGCNYDKFDRLPKREPIDVAPNMDIADMRALYRDKPLKIFDDVVIAGHVTATDKSNNFYRTFMIQDASAAIEVKAGLQDLHNIYRQGQHIVILCKDLSIGLSAQGVLQVGVGREGWDGLYVDYFGYKSLLGKHLLRNTEFVGIEPLQLTLSQLNESMTGLLVKIDALTLETDEPDTWTTEQEALYTSTHYRRFKDKGGNEIIVATSVYANFARKTIPRNELSLVGILQYGKMSSSGAQRYLLKIRDEQDIVL